MHNIRLVLFLGFASGLVWAQTGGLGSLQDPRLADQRTVNAMSFQPWLAISGSYDTYLSAANSAGDSVLRTLNPSGGFSLAKSYQRTTVVVGYSGAGNGYLGGTLGDREGWRSSNVGLVALSTQLSKRLVLDVSETGGAANGGFGATAAGLASSGLGVLGSLGLSPGSLYGAGSGIGTTGAGSDPLQNGLVDSDYYQQMSYFSSSSVGLGYMLSRRTMINVQGTASFVRRSGRSYADANTYGTNAMFSTFLSRRVSLFGGYSYQRMDFVQSIGNTNVHGVFGGVTYRASTHDSFSISYGQDFVDSNYVTTVALPADVAALLGVSSARIATNSQRTFYGGNASYDHSFRHGGFRVACMTNVLPGNDLILLAHTESCTTSLSHSLSNRLSIGGIGGYSRLNGISQTGSRYQVFSGGVSLDYALFHSISFTTGSSYRHSTLHPSDTTMEDVVASAGLRWAPTRR
jgi:hypothetical protein